MNPVPANEYLYLEPLLTDCRSMLELGNKKNPNGLYKTWFEELGIQHVSVDWNGQDGALRYDLRSPIDWAPLGGPFDIVTNFGTTEHIDSQAGAWRNIHEAIRLGGHLVSVTPAPEAWWWHGEWYPTETFFRRFAGWNGYQVEVLERTYPAAHIGDASRQLLVAVLLKVEELDFTMADGLYQNEIRPR